jgi:hypothetical protein
LRCSPSAKMDAEPRAEVWLASLDAAHHGDLARRKLVDLAADEHPDPQPDSSLASAPRKWRT